MYTIYPNTTSIQGTDTSILSLTSDGFTCDNNAATGGGNASGSTLAGWFWKASGSTSANTDGTISSTVSVNATAGFSIVSYTGNDTNGATIGHGLSSKPDLIIVKALAGATNWPVYNSTRGATKTIWLDGGGGEGTGDGYWYNTEPTASVFSVGRSSQTNNTAAYIAYCFTAIEGYSRVGQYTGNQTFYPFAYLGFRPQFLLIKGATYSSDWHLFDNKRIGYNYNNYDLTPSENNIELTDEELDFVSNGFRIRTNAANINSGGNPLTLLRCSGITI